MITLLLLLRMLIIVCSKPIYHPSVELLDLPETCAILARTSPVLQLNLIIFDYNEIPCNAGSKRENTLTYDTVCAFDELLKYVQNIRKINRTRPPLTQM